MAFVDMKAELAEAIPNLSRVYAGKLINRAWRVVRNSTMWSFQLKQGGFSTPGIVTAGTVTFPLLPIPSQVIGDATASAAWNALTYPPITAYQLQVSNSAGIYSIIAADFTNPNAVVLTLDRPFSDFAIITNASGNTYQMLQAYMPAPSPTFRRWLTVQDMVNGYALRIWNSRRDLNILDPQRQITTDPTDMIGMGTDQRQGIDNNGNAVKSATFGYEMYEMWPWPTSAISYMTFYVDNGADLVANSDTLPWPIDQDVVLQKARTYAYEWAESRKDVMAPRGAGANYAVLRKTTNDEFYARLKTLRLMDKDAVDAYAATINAASPGFGLLPFYNAQTQRSGMGWPLLLYGGR